jgi:urease accessory protein UreH
MESPSTVKAQSLAGKLVLGFKSGTDGRTRLCRRYRNALFHFSKPYWDGQQLVVQVLNPTAGVFENDRMESEVELDEGARACLVSPSSTQVYAMPGTGVSRLEQTFRLSAGSALAVLPKWLVLHRGARYEQRTRVELKEGCSLFLVDLISAGRNAFGEFLEYDRLMSSVDIKMDGRLILRERFAGGSSEKRWIWESASRRRTHLATVYISFPGAAAACDELASGISVAETAGAEIGVTPLEENFVVLRLFADSALSIQRALMQAMDTLGQYTAVSNVYQRVF